MYESLLSARENPFGVAPDPRFYYRSSSHREALAALEYGVREKRGVMTLVGEAGSGKTLLLETLLAGLDRSVCATLVAHTTLGRHQFLQSILLGIRARHGARVFSPSVGAALSRDAASLSQVELVAALRRFVVEETTARGRTPLLIVDEAQNLSLEVLEELRLVASPSSRSRAALQLVLSGLPTLETRLASPRALPLSQRVAVRARLEPLDAKEAGEYVRFRLERAGAKRIDVFDLGALYDIWAAAGGVPRTMNVICDCALVIAFGSGLSRVDRETARAAIADVGARLPTDSAAAISELQAELGRLELVGEGEPLEQVRSRS